MSLYAYIKKLVVEQRLIQSGETVLVSVSGGIDSMVLLDLVARISKGMNVKVCVAHVNHMLRGADSNADERLVRNAAKKYGISCSVKKLKPAAGRNLQDSARALRYGFLEQEAARREARSVLLAHHRGDQAETVLMHLLRGAGISGLCGMRRISMMGDVRLVRPLLGVSRKEISAYARSRKIAFREDATNAKTKYRRNDIRHRLIPLLAEFNPRIEANLAALAERLSEEDAAMAAVAEASFSEALISEKSDAIVIDRDAYEPLPVAVRRRLMRHAYCVLTGGTHDLNADQLIRMDQIAMSKARSGSYRLPAGCSFKKDGRLLGICRAGSGC